MANWNLSVDLRGHGNDLAQSLKSSAKHARSLGNAARTAKTEVKELGHASETAGRYLRTLGREARTAGRRLDTLGSGARTAARQLARYGDAARTANRHVNTLGDHSRTTGRQLARMSGQIDGAVRDLLRLADAARRADARLGRVGGSSVHGLRRITTESGHARRQLASLATLLTGGAFVIGGAEMLKMGGELQQSMNAFGATTGATAMQMQRASATANQLGNDLSLPGATAADAAEAMVELAKAGFRTDQAISSTRASLVLASAAQVNAADSAKYLGDMMDQFGMGADQAGQAADTLAATANAASGDIMDIYYAMKYAGPVAHGLGVTMQETAAAVGMLGKAGILGQTAGTTLRGMMANLAAPTPQMVEGLKAMGIEAWDASGNFKGLRTVIDGLSKAQHRMSQQDFAAAVKKSMGKPAMSGAIALAHQGVDSFDSLMAAVSDTGAAANIAAAKGKGLAGALLQLKTQAKQTGLTIYQGMAPGLEFLTRGITSGLTKATPKIEHFFDYFNDAATLFGPDLAAAARDEFDGIADAAKGMAGGFKDLGSDALAAFLHLVLTSGQLVVDVLENLAAGVQPVVSALGDLSDQGGTVASTMDLAVTALDLAASAVSALSTVLGPIGHVVGGLVSGFAALPGPVQQFVLAALLVRRIQPAMTGLATTVSGRVTGAYRSLNAQMAVQRSLAASAGVSLTRYGAAMAVLQTRVPIIGRMGDSFRTAAAAGSGFTGTLRGITAAAGTGLRGAMGGLMGAMGGPWGLAITGLTVGLSLLATSQQAASQRAAEHKATIDGLTQAMRQSNGVIDESVRQQAAQTIQNTKLKGTSQSLVDVMGAVGYSLSDVTDAYLGQGESVDQLADKMIDLAKAKGQEAFDKGGHDPDKGIMKQASAYAAAGKALKGMSGDAKEAAQNAKDLDAATKGTGDGASAYDKLKGAVAALADKTADADSRTRALREALDLLSGGSVSLQAAQARVNEALTNANAAMKDGIQHADGYGKALLKTNGQLDTTSKNGQALFNTLNTVADGSASAAVAAYDFAQSQGKDLPASMAAARAEMEKSRKAAIDLMGGYGLTATQAGKVADSLGLIPGQVSILLSTKGVDSTLAELLAVQAEFKRVPNAKTIKVDALGADAKKELEDLGYKIKLIPGTREYKITAPTQGARAQLDLLIAKLSGVKGKNVPVGVIDRASATARAIQAAIDRIRSKSVTLTTVRHTINIEATVSRTSKNLAGYASGGIVDHYADGGIQRGGVRHFDSGSENHVAQIAPGGSWRVWGEPETQGEGYVPFARSKRPRSRAITEEIVRRLGGDPNGIQWNADGSITHYADGSGFSYTPPGGLKSASDVQSSYSDAHQSITKDEYNKKIRARANAVDSLRTAETRLATVRRHHHTHAQLVAAENAVAKARRGLATATDAAKSAEARYKKQFSLSDWSHTLAGAVKSSRAYEANLSKIAARGGGDVIDQLRDMGAEGAAMVSALAKASGKQFAKIVADLRKLGPLAKATLADYTKQMNAATKTDKAFEANLAKLAAMGFGDLAGQLAAQGDEAAQKIAAEAVKSKSAAGKADKAAKANAKTLSDEQLSELVSIIAAIKTSKTGIHDVAGATGLGEDEIIAVANKARTQIGKSLGGRSARFLADLGKANKGLSYANGGIRSGIYATRGGAVTFAEPSTGGEAYVPLGANKRRSATAVLGDVAGRFGLGLTDAWAGRVVIIREQGPLVGAQHWHIADTPRARDLARRIDDQTSYQLRRLARGGVGAR